MDISVDGDTIGPNGERVDLPGGEPLAITFTADRAGELHVHSRPEQILEFRSFGGIQPSGSPSMSLRSLTKKASAA